MAFYTTTSPNTYTLPRHANSPLSNLGVWLLAHSGEYIITDIIALLLALRRRWHKLYISVRHPSVLVILLLAVSKLSCSTGRASTVLKVPSMYLATWLRSTNYIERQTRTAHSATLAPGADLDLSP